MNTFDVVILGSGYGGSIMSMIARRLGYSTLLVERAQHPRFAIGESSTPFANLLLEEIATEHNLPLKSCTKWGAWQRDHPQIACGLKRGFSFFHHEFGHEFNHADRAAELLVAASPANEIADTHWYRPDFDAHLVEVAKTLGVEYWDRTEVEAVTAEAEHVFLSLTRSGVHVPIKARFVIDATGPRGALHRHLALGSSPLPGLPPTQTVFTHFRNVSRLNWFESESPPYPVDDAAVHHVFDGGWIWVLHFNNGIASAGAAFTPEVGGRFGLSEGEAGWKRLLEQLPSVQAQFAEAVPVMGFQYWPQLAFRSTHAAGERWALLPSAAGIVDPLLSTGFPLNLLGIQRLARILKDHLENPAKALAKYEAQTFAELDATSNLVGALYHNMQRFDRFRMISLLYFVAAIYSETSRRLGRKKPGMFLLGDDPLFAAGLARCCELARGSDDKNLGSAVFEVLEKYDLGGLSKPDRNQWHPCLAEDLRASRERIHASPAEIESLLRRCGFE